MQNSPVGDNGEDVHLGAGGAAAAAGAAEAIAVPSAVKATTAAAIRPLRNFTIECLPFYTVTLTCERGLETPPRWALRQPRHTTNGQHHWASRRVVE
jgi:hypothetical protein